MGLAVAVFIAAVPAQGGSGKDSLGASATVMPFVKYKFLHQEKFVNVTEQDVKTGHSDIDRAIVFSVHTNSAEGYMLTFSIKDRRFEQSIVYYGKKSFRITKTDNELFIPITSTGITEQALSFRFLLGPDMKSGKYPWPFGVMIGAL